MNAKRLSGILIYAPFILMGISLTGCANATEPVKTLCAPRNDVLTRLRDHKEELQHRGLSASGNVLEITVSQGEDKSWTALLTNPLGVTCLVSSGLYWETKAPELIVKAKVTATFDTQ